MPVRPPMPTFGGPAPTDPRTGLYALLSSVPSDSLSLTVHCEALQKSTVQDDRFPVFGPSATRYDFAAFLLKRPDALGEARLLEKVLSRPGWDLPVGQTYWLQCLMKYPPDQLKNLIQASNHLYNLGWVQDASTMVYTMTLMEEALEKGNLTPAALEALPHKIVQAFKAKAQPLSAAMPPLENIFVQTLKKSLDTPPKGFFPMSSMSLVQQVFAKLGELQHFQKIFTDKYGVSRSLTTKLPDSDGLWVGVENLLRENLPLPETMARLDKIQTTLTQLQEAPTELIGAIRLYQSGAIPEQQALLLKALPTYLAQGGSAAFLLSYALPGNIGTLTFPISDPELQDCIRYTQERIQDLFQRIPAFRSPEEVARFEKVFSIFYGKIHRPVAEQMDWIEVLSHLYSSLSSASDEAQDPHKLQHILNKAPSLQELQQLATGLPEVLDSTLADRDLNPLLVRGIFNGATLPVLKAKRRFLGTIRQGCSEELAAPQLEKAYEPFLNELTKGKLPLPLFEEMTQGLLPTLIQLHQQGRDTSKLSYPLKDCMAWVQEDKVRLQDLPQILSPLLEMTERLKEQPFHLGLFCLITSGQDDSPQITPEGIRQVLGWFRAYQDAGNTGNNTVPAFLELLSSLKARQIPKEDWGDYVQEFSKAAPLLNNWTATPGSQILKIWLEFVKENGPQVLQTPLLSEIISAADLLETQFFTVKGFGGAEKLNILRLFLSSSRTLSDFQHHITMLSVLLDHTQPIETKSNLLDLMIQTHRPALKQHPELMERWQYYVQHSQDPEVKYKTFFMERLFLLASSPTLASLSQDGIQKLLSHMPKEDLAAGRDFLGELAGVFHELEKAFPSTPRIKAMVAEQILALPHSWHKTAQFFSRNASRIWGDAEMGLSLDAWEKNLQMFTYSYFPTKLLSHVVMNLEHLLPETLHTLYYDVEYGQEPGKEIGLKALPELMAMMEPYFALAKKRAPSKTATHWGIASGALTRLYDYTGAGVYHLERIAMQNWGRIGTTGLSFSKWQFDAMSRWKGQGPMEQGSLLEASGLFQKIPPRKDDATYHGGYFRYDEETGISIELRRAYMVISSPNSGTLVIRNSSPVFGRDKLPEPAYYSDIMWYNGLNNLFDPEEALGKDAERNRFNSVLGVQLNRTIQAQQASHQNIEFLLNALEEVMQQYTAWKCGFVDGRPPKGFSSLLQAAAQSARPEQGGPFSTIRPTRLAWVDPYALPYPLKVFDLEDPKNQGEAAFYQATLLQPNLAREVTEYKNKMPRLTGFLAEGLEKGWELILMPPVTKAAFPERHGGTR